MKIKNIEWIANPLVTWYQENKRILPWREGKNPYHIWLSEVMLQQTRIEAVKVYYYRFLRELPTIADLAKVEEEKLLKLWEGLGYYNRARNLKKAAEVVVEKYNGIMPNTYEELLSLPGIGEYTAGAIASIAYDKKEPAVDGNVLRVIARAVGSKDNVLLPSVKKEVTEQLKKVMPEQAGDFNEGIMELGETICLPNGEPLCVSCPLNVKCYAYKDGLTQEIPVREKKLERRKENRTVFVLLFKNKVAILKRENKGLLSGMYEFPNELEITEEDIPKQLEKWDLKVKKVQKIGEYKHIFTHIEWNMIGYFIEVESENTQFFWVEKEELKEKYAIPTAFKKFRMKLEASL